MTKLERKTDTYKCRHVAIANLNIYTFIDRLSCSDQVFILIYCYDYVYIVQLT